MRILIYLILLYFKFRALFEESQVVVEFIERTFKVEINQNYLFKFNEYVIKSYDKECHSKSHDREYNNECHSKSHDKECETAMSWQI